MRQCLIGSDGAMKAKLIEEEQDKEMGTRKGVKGCMRVSNLSTCPPTLKVGGQVDERKRGRGECMSWFSGGVGF